MAWSASAVFELRPDGDSRNGMGFDPAFGGTDFSMQASPAISVADGVTNGTTTVTSATAAFAAAHLGNGLNIAGDGLYQIVAVVSAMQVTVDRNTANGGAGRTFRVGGAGTIAAQGLDPVGLGVVVGGQTIWVRATNSAGVLTPYANITTASPQTGTTGTKDNPVVVLGYGTIRGDNVRAQFSGAQVNGFLVNGFAIVKNFTNVASAPGWGGCYLIVSGNQALIENWWVKQTSDDPAVSVTGSNCFLNNCLFDGTGFSLNAPVAQASGAATTWQNCVFTNARSWGGVWLQGPLGQVFDGCIFWKNGGFGVKDNAGTANALFRNCVFWGNTASAQGGGDGLRLGGAAAGITAYIVRDCIFGKNAGYDLNFNQQDDSALLGAAAWMAQAWTENFFLTTGTSRYRQLPANPNDTTLAVDPFVASASGNFTLNSTTGGGALVIANPTNVTFVDGLNGATYVAGIALQSGPAGGGGDLTAATTLMRSLWRERTNERLYPATNSGVPDSVVDIYLDWALHWLNRIARYHFTTDSSSLVLVAGTQEYSPFTDLVEVKWIRWGQHWLQKGDIERWRGDDLAWDEEPAGVPREFAQYGLNIVFRPTPSAEAVAENPDCVVRYVSTPPSITTSGPVQLPSQAYRVVVDKAAAIWFESYPDTALAEGKQAAITKEAEDAAQLFAAEIGQRGITR